ncbi:Predicted oxidoreductase [Clostridium sp. DSM 8431]|uniref:aldo/keto reductase n=1 Tax=Clostridium sp. DSM 8431 TaxID=1761781 RepID=UPI0008E4A818|nr:aldo/keto reductase [Clostridium sp. DSM 8431]SFU33328.1 Predicted oxidoreductase [Clostridium sp. DSM 8431]
MEYIKLGNSDLKVSKICLGCMGFGDASKGMHSWTLPLEESKEIIKHALDAGINFFDTAMAYQGGTSEEFLGEAIRQYASREDVVIATKYIPRSKEAIDKGITAEEHINECLKNSLKRLQMDYVDLYILHMWDYDTPIEETMRILNNLVKSGKVRYIGISNCYAWQIAKANEIAKAHGYSQFISVQGHYNLIFREEEREMAPYCKVENISMTPYSALASGRLAKPIGENSKRLKEDNFAKGEYDATKEQDLEIIKRVQEIADKRNVSMTEVSLSWLLSKTSSPVVGATKKSHIDGAVKAVNLKLTEEEIKYLEELYKPHAIVGVMAQR